MKKSIFLLITALFSAIMSFGQNVIRKGNTFVSQPSEKQIQKDEPIKTQYTFVAKDGLVYPIWLSKNGKAFIIRTSKKTGKEYRQYLPEVTAELENEIGRETKRSKT